MKAWVHYRDWSEELREKWEEVGIGGVWEGGGAAARLEF